MASPVSFLPFLSLRIYFSSNDAHILNSCVYLYGERKTKSYYRWGITGGHEGLRGQQGNECFRVGGALFSVGDQAGAADQHSGFGGQAGAFSGQVGGIGGQVGGVGGEGGKRRRR